MTDNLEQHTNEHDYFQSVAAIRMAHSELLQQMRNEDSSPNFLDEIVEFLQRGVATGVLIDDWRDRQSVQGFLDYWDNYLAKVNQPTVEAILAEFDPEQAPELPESDCPYLGLAAFSEDHAEYFHGRERIVGQLVDHLRKNRFLAVVGPSGSGKSSVVLAGLLPKLKQGDVEGSSYWHYYARIVPGANPLRNLANELGDEKLAEQLFTDPSTLQHFLDTHHPNGALLVIDQFEETFTLCLDRPLRQAYLDSLIHLVTAENNTHTVILTMRTDFETFVATYEQFNELFIANVIRMMPMTAPELREAIEQPADAVGLRFETGVVDALVQDVVGEPAALPLLQFTLLKLWENREKNRITWNAYQRLGGGRLALARSADQLYEGLLPEDQVTARRILLRMVRPGEGLEVTNNRIRLNDIAGEAQDRVERVLKRLIDGHLVKFTEGKSENDSQIEVAHEALVRNWPKLVEWLEGARTELRQRLRLTAAAEQWIQEEEDTNLLWRGDQLRETAKYDDLNEQEQRFREASIQAEKNAKAEAEAIRQRELMQAQALAKEQSVRAQEAELASKQLRNRRNIAFGIATLAIFASLIAFNFFWQANRNAADAENNLATATVAQGLAVAEATRAAESRLMAIAETTRAATNLALAETRFFESENASENAIAQLNNAQATIISLEATATGDPSGTNAPTPTSLASSLEEQTNNFRLTATAEAINELTFPTDATIGTEIIRPKDGMAMVYVPAGSFMMGSPFDDNYEAEQNHLPQHPVTLNSFWIDRTEVTALQFTSFLNENLEASGMRSWIEISSLYSTISFDGDQFEPIDGLATHPAVEVSWYGAMAYCQWANVRLPTEEEWEYSARGSDNLVFPWGNEFDGGRLNFCDTNCPRDSIKTISADDSYTTTAPVGAYADGQSWVGAYDMAGNVAEWMVNTPYTYTNPNANPSSGPVFLDSLTTQRVVRGGSWANGFDFTRSFHRAWPSPNETSDFVGFRCVASP